jgi:excisionase family DNA binding protein
VGREAKAPLGERLTVTIEEAAAILGIGRTLAYEAVRRGELPAVRVGRRLLVPIRQLTALVNGDAAPSSAPRPGSRRR